MHFQIMFVPVCLHVFPLSFRDHFQPIHKIDHDRDAVLLQAEFNSMKTLILTIKGNPFATCFLRNINFGHRCEYD